MTFCQKGRELLLDLQRSDWLPAYDEDGVRIILTEMEDISNAINLLHEEFKEYEGNYPNQVKVSFSYYLACQFRNERYITRYFFNYI